MLLTVRSVRSDDLKKLPARGSVPARRRPQRVIQQLRDPSPSERLRHPPPLVASEESLQRRAWPSRSELSRHEDQGIGRWWRHRRSFQPVPNCVLSRESTVGRPPKCAMCIYLSIRAPETPAGLPQYDYQVCATSLARAASREVRASCCAPSFGPKTWMGDAVMASFARAWIGSRSEVSS